MAAGTVTRAKGTALCACLLVLVFASTSGAAARVGIGKMTVVPNRVTAGTTDNELSFAFTADSAPLKGTTLVDVPRGWSKPQQTEPGRSRATSSCRRPAASARGSPASRAAGS